MDAQSRDPDPRSINSRAKVSHPYAERERRLHGGATCCYRRGVLELRRHIERVAAMRRALPPGGLVTGDYRFETESRLQRPRPACSAIKRRWWFTITCFGPEQEAAVPRCAPNVRRGRLGRQSTPTTLLSGCRSWWSRAHRCSGSRRSSANLGLEEPQGSPRALSPMHSRADYGGSSGRRIG